MIDRRSLVGGAALLGWAAALTAVAQRSQQLPRVAYMVNNTPMAELMGADPADPHARAFMRGLRELGWVEGRNIVIERQSAEGRPERVPALVQEVVDRQVDLIVVYGPVLALAAKQASRTIPVVAIGVGDFVGRGLATQLDRPGGNITGLSLQVGLGLAGKRLELLKQLAPKASRIAFIRARPLVGRPLWTAETEAAAKALGLTLSIVAVDTPEELDVALAVLARERPDAILCSDTPIVLGNRRRIIDFAARERLPAVYALREFAVSGGLMSYAADLVALSRRAPSYVDKILKGAKPGELPIEQPTKFELVVNLKTAKALGLVIPPSLLLQTDEVIE